MLHFVESQNDDINKNLREIKKVERVCLNDKCKKNFIRMKRKCDSSGAKNVQKIDNESSRF